MKIDAVKWGGVLLIMLALMAGSARAAWAWQANTYGQQLAAKEAAHQTERTNLANANSAQVLAEQGKRLALEQWLAASDQSHYRALTDEQTQQAGFQGTNDVNGSPDFSPKHAGLVKRCPVTGKQELPNAVVRLKEGLAALVEQEGPPSKGSKQRSRGRRRCRPRASACLWQWLWYTTLKS